MKTARRKKFEQDTFPHLEALWETAMWLTMHGNTAENLVLVTMARAYRECQDSGDVVGGKARLFRILAREFFGFAKQKQQWHKAIPFHSENDRIIAGPEGRNRQSTMSKIKHLQLPRLAGISDGAVKGAIARLRPHSRLMLILLHRERFSYADIAYITDLSETSVKMMLTRLRRLIPGYVLETAESLMGTPESQPAAGANGGKSDRDLENISLGLSSISTREYSTSAAVERWENDGGAVAVQSRR